MDHSEADADPWVAALTRYLREHPQASDTAEGIARWWLQAAVADWPKVRRAIAAMAAAGRLTVHVAGDGREHYRLAAPAPAPPRAPSGA
jgi:hypothetical protein